MRSRPAPSRTSSSADLYIAVGSDDKKATIIEVQTGAVEHEFTARVEHAAPPLPAAARWVARDELDFAAMPADDAHWYERVLDGELLHGSFVFGAPNALRGKHVRALSALLDDDDGASQPYTRIKLPGGHPILDEVRYTD